METRHHEESGGPDNTPIATRFISETMDAVENDIGKLNSSLQDKYTKLLSSQIDRLKDMSGGGPNQKVYVNIKSREVIRRAKSDKDIPEIGSGKENNPNRSNLESEIKIEIPQEITRIKIRQFKKIENSGQEESLHNDPGDEQANIVNKKKFRKITYREKIIQRPRTEIPKLADSVDGTKEVVEPHCHGQNTITDKNLPSPGNSDKHFELTKKQTDSQPSARINTERAVLTRGDQKSPIKKGAESPILARNRTKSTSPKRKVIKSPVIISHVIERPESLKNGTETPSFARHEGKDADGSVLAESDAESVTLTRSSERRHTESHVFSRGGIESHAFSKGGPRSISSPRGFEDSPRSVRDGEKSRSVTGVSENPEKANNTINRSSQGAGRRNVESPISTRKGAKSRGDVLNHMVHGSGVESPTLFRVDTLNTFNSDYASNRSPICRSNQTLKDIPSARSRRCPVWKEIVSHDSFYGAQTSALARSTAAKSTTERTPFRCPVWKEFVRTDSLNIAHSSASVRPTVTKSPVERKLQKMVERLEDYNKSISPKMENIKASLSPRKPRERFFVPAVEHNVEKNLETKESMKLSRPIKQEILPEFQDTNTTYITEHTEKTSSSKTDSKASSNLTSVKKEKEDQELYREYMTIRTTVAAKPHDIHADQTEIKRNRGIKGYLSIKKDTGLSQTLREPRRQELASLISPISDDHDIVRRLEFSSPTQSQADSSISSESEKSQKMYGHREMSNGAEKKTTFQRNSTTDIHQSRKSANGTPVRVQNQSKKELCQYRRYEHESKLKTQAGLQNETRKGISCLEDGSHFTTSTVPEDSFFSRGLSQSSRNSTFLFEPSDNMNHYPIAQSTPISDGSTVLFSSFSSNRGPQPSDIQQTVSANADSEGLCSRCREKENRHSNERTKAYNNIGSACPGASENTKKYCDRCVACYSATDRSGKRIGKGKGLSIKNSGNESNDDDFNPDARLTELVQHQLHQLRNPNGHHLHIVTSETNEIIQNTLKEIKDNDEGNWVNLTQKDLQMLRVIRKKIFSAEPVNYSGEQAYVSEEEKEMLRLIEKVDPVEIGKHVSISQEEKSTAYEKEQIDDHQSYPVEEETRNFKFHEDFNQIRRTQEYETESRKRMTSEDLRLMKLISMKVFPKRLHNKKESQTNISQEDQQMQNVNMPVALDFDHSLADITKEGKQMLNQILNENVRVYHDNEEGTQRSEAQESHIKEGAEKNIEISDGLDQDSNIANEMEQIFQNIVRETSSLQNEECFGENITQETESIVKHFKNAINKDAEKTLKAYQSNNIRGLNRIDNEILQVQQFTKEENTEQELSDFGQHDESCRYKNRERNFKSIEIQTKSTIGNQTEIRNDQPNQTDVYSESIISTSHRKNADGFSFSIETEKTKINSVHDSAKVDTEENIETAAKKSVDEDFHREIWIAISDNVHRLNGDIEWVMSRHELQTNGSSPETTIKEAEYLLLNRIETLLSLCTSLNKDAFRKQMEELICRLQGACLEQGVRSRDSIYMNETRKMLNGLKSHLENFTVCKERPLDEEVGDSQPTEAERQDKAGSSGFKAALTRSSGFEASQTISSGLIKTTNRLLEFYRAVKIQDHGSGIFPRRGTSTVFERVLELEFLQRHLYIFLITIGLVLGIVIVFCGPSVAKVFYGFICAAVMHVLCNFRLIQPNPAVT